MQERPENFNTGADDPEATLVSPRFDADDARHAHPVVPLAEAREPFVNRRARRGLRRPWSPALLAVALLAVVAVGGVVASKVLRRTQPNPAAAVAPAQAAEAPALTEMPPAAEAPREVAGTKSPSRATRARRAEVVSRIAQGDDEEFEDEDGGRRDKRHGKHRARVEDEGDKELRQVLKDAAKKKAPRLVDVLVKP
jgi:hypothetical protein